MVNSFHFTRLVRLCLTHQVSAAEETALSALAAAESAQRTADDAESLAEKIKRGLIVHDIYSW